MAIHLTRIYTRTGDDGTTALGNFERTHKTDARLIAYADTDETGAVLGLAIATGQMTEQLTDIIRRIQNDLFDVGADLCVPLAEKYDYPPLRVKAEWIAELERDIDLLNEPLAKLDSFILAGGTPAAAFLHQARTVSRRAERAVWTAIEQYGTETDGQGVNILAAKYLNRLSDLLFVAARSANSAVGDVLWQPGGGRDSDDNAQETATD